MLIVDRELIHQSQSARIPGKTWHDISAALHRYQSAAESSNGNDFEVYGNLLRKYIARHRNAPTCAHLNLKRMTALGWTWKYCLDCPHTQDEVRRAAAPQGRQEPA